MNSGKPSYTDPKPDSNHLYTLTIDNPNDNPDPEWWQAFLPTLSLSLTLTLNLTITL